MTNSQRETILVVDDVAGNLEIMSNILSVDYDLKVAKSGKKALQIACLVPLPSLILLDVIMPEMDGFETCRRLKADPLCKAVPVIFVSTQTDMVDEAMGFSVGGVDYISKPVSPPLVRARVKTHLALYNQNRILERKVRERTLELMQTRDVAILAITSLAETRDNETGEHIKRTQHYIRLLAQHMKKNPRFSKYLDDETIELLYKSAPLHDVGKIGIRDSILLKPGPLTSDEFTVMKTHTTIGRDTINKSIDEINLESVSSFLQIGREIASSHHEKWDGSGYPLGLLGDDIPFSGRLMAICDVYDALISKRVYKDAFPHEKAVEIILEGRGKHFDPDLVDAFIELKSKFYDIASGKI
ncbi:MAG: two-component system response regulator [Candidatus Riflebacteria bacterium HGW-Riflebacteria-2]|jgi:putative two-component system response regulator|nr:MAG: two-component system response regulator [Candidatus Riflebacteria bacterium HGW-Riflebacteria-2]